jgi:hypothetical protein
MLYTPEKAVEWTHNADLNPSRTVAFVWIDGRFFFGEWHSMMLDDLLNNHYYDYKELMKLPQYWGWVKYYPKSDHYTVVADSAHFPEQDESLLYNVAQELNQFLHGAR